ncbi:alpha/beta fold hydrolase [Nocardia cyriacigeorgica]|uniref:lipase family alpha/beta hydrolase n=1 Tax=Nocardia cyriacigeorgica TaxID=135487 RepID=UPI001894DB6E|nr:alpha/beta fold hydrolase [Nocardia cyriacigeorgica]MBF6319236.1 alpha/beta fold hydrolase [Nocardia cyriacigeorgica]MBF6535394.1 alpha/beta fold hydrolase [Nocardia cyriacigeorgica]
MRRAPVTAVIVAVLAALWVSSAGAAQAERYPVVYNFFAGIPGELTNPGGSLPGSNDWSCRPGAEHPNPVVLAHGTGGGAQTNWGTYVALLANEGYCVYSLTYGAYDLPWPISALGGMMPVQANAAEFGAFVDRVRAATGAERVDIVAHSQGGLVANYFVKRLGGAGKVDKLVSLAVPWLGTTAFGMADVAAFARAVGLGEAWNSIPCLACAQMPAGGQFLAELNADGIYHPSVTYTNIVGNMEEIVVPYTSAVPPGPNVTNIVVQHGCAQDYSEHLDIAGSPRAAAHVLNALDPAHPREVPCHFVAPFTG